MKYTKHFNVSKTLAERIKFMSPGELLPTVGELMDEFEASQATISSALTRLKNQGLVERPMGRKRMVVAEHGDKTLFRIAFIRPLWSSPDFDAVFNAIYEAGHEEHWGFSVYNFTETATLNLDRAMENADAAIILGANNPAAELIKAFNGCRKPLVFLRDKPDVIKSSLVWVDDREVGRMATRHLLDLGHRKILVMLSEPPNPSSSTRMLGWRDEMLAAGQKKIEELTVDCSVRPGKNATIGSYERFKRWLTTEKTDFTAIFCVSWTGALAAMRAFRESGLTIPQDVSVITYGSESSFSDFLNPPLTTIQTDAKMHADETIRLIKEALLQRRAEFPAVLLTPQFSEGRSTCPPKSLTSAIGVASE